MLLARLVLETTASTTLALADVALAHLALADLALALVALADLASTMFVVWGYGSRLWVWEACKAMLEGFARKAGGGAKGGHLLEPAHVYLTTKNSYKQRLVTEQGGLS